MANYVRHARGGHPTHEIVARGRIYRVWLVLLVLCIGGCSAPGPAIKFSTIANAPPAAIEAGKRIAADPEAFLREVQS